MIFVIGGMKYGISKTTTAVNLAIYLSTRKNREVLLVDSDPSECASEFIRWRNKNHDCSNLSSIQLHGTSILTEINKLKSKFDDIVIDSGVGENLKQALLVADRLIVPFNSKDLGLWTVWTLTNLETAVDRAWDHNPHLQAFSFFICKPDENSNSKDIVNTLRKSQHINFIEDTPLNQDMIGKAMQKGYSIFDLKHPEKSSVNEMSKIFDNVNS